MRKCRRDELVDQRLKTVISWLVDTRKMVEEVAQQELTLWKLVMFSIDQKKSFISHHPTAGGSRGSNCMANNLTMNVKIEGSWTNSKQA